MRNAVSTVTCPSCSGIKDLEMHGVYRKQCPVTHLKTTMTFNLIDSRPGQAARVLDGLKRINAYAASEQHGASLREIEAVHKAVVARAGFTDGKAPSCVLRCTCPSARADAVVLSLHSDDLISMLISDPDNKDLWETQLLGSQFAKDMLAVTGSLDENFNAVLEGFKAYMIVRDLAYDTAHNVPHLSCPDSPCPARLPILHQRDQGSERTPPQGNVCSRHQHKPRRNC